MTGIIQRILNKKIINLKNLLFLSILFILMILNFSFIKIHANDKNTVNDSQDNLVKKQLRQLSKEALDMKTISTQKEQEFNKALTKSRKILEECENKYVESEVTEQLVEFDNININLKNKLNEIIKRKGTEIGQYIKSKYNFELETERIEKARQISYKMIKGKTEYITTLTNEETELIKIIVEYSIEMSKIFQPFLNNYITAINNLKNRIKYLKTGANPKTEITETIAEYKKTLEEKLKEFKKNIEKQIVKK